MQFHASVFAPEHLQNLCHTQTDRHFIKIMKSCSGHPKTRKSVKNRKSKNFKIPILFSYLEYEKKVKKNKLTDKNYSIELYF